MEWRLLKRKLVQSRVIVSSSAALILPGEKLVLRASAIAPALP